MKEVPPYIRFTFIGILIGLIILAMSIGSDILLPLSWALLFALLILPVHKRLEKWVRYRGLAALLSVLILIIIIGGVIFLLSSQVVNLINDLPKVLSKLTTYLRELRVYIDQKMGVPYHEQPSELIDRFSSFLQEKLSSIGSALSSTVKTLIYIGILPIYIFLILYYRNRLNQFFGMLYRRRPGKGEAALQTLWKAGDVVQKYLTGMSIVTLIVAVLAFILFISLGIKHALFFAIFIAVFNLIPYIGVFVASLISILYVMITKDGLLYPLLTLILLWGIQLIENNLITPFIVGRQIQLNPLAVLLAIILGGLIWGVSGMILFIPFLGAIKVIFDEIPALRPYGFLLGDDPPDD